MSAPGAAAAIVIGRNEGDRLVRCLASIHGRYQLVIYVDSGSSDGSETAAAAAGAEVVALDMSKPFTAARARNAGAARLTGADAPAYLQFIDGDCEMSPNWGQAAARFLDAHPDFAVAAGQLRERRPDASIYNRLCDLEWRAPAGEAEACGGIAMMRRAAFEQAGGFRDDLIAGEEPELCLRLRRAGWRVMRLSDEMGWHDAAMTRFAEWWRRTRRAGFAAAEGAALHWGGGERYNQRRLARALLWGAAGPAAIILGLMLHPAAALGALAYPAQIFRLAARGGFSRDAALFALFNTLGKFAEAAGALSYVFTRMAGRRAALIEYK